MSQTMMLVPKRHRASFRERVSRALDAVRSYTLTGLLSSDKKTAEIFGFGSKTDAGVVVTAQNAFTFSAVFDAVNQGSSDLAKLPLNLLKRLEGGGSEHYTASRTYRLLKDEPNPEMSAMDFRQTLQAHAMTRTGGFAEIERDGAGRPFWLWPITPDRVERKRDGSGPLYYLVDGKDRIPARDMLDIRGLGYDGSCGYDVIDKARQAIGLALAAEKFGASFFGSGAGFPGLLGIEGAVGPASMDALRKHVDEQYGPGSWNRFLIIDNKPSFTPFGVEPQKAQMNELRTKQVEEVARFFNFPVHKLKNLDRATNNNIEQQDLEYYKGFMLNWTTKWEQECNRKLVSPLESRQQFIKHNVNAFLRGDMAARAAFYQAMLDRGVFCADDVLELEDRNPQPNGLGKMFLVNSTMVPKDKLNAMMEAKLTPPPPPAAPTPEDPDDDGVTQQDVDAANARATEAERVAAEMRTSAEAAEQRVASLEATASATDAELAEVRAAATSEATRATTAEALAAQMRSQAETVQEQFVAAEAERARLAEALAQSQADRQADVSRLEAELQAEAARAQSAEADAETQRQHAEALTVEREQSEAVMSTLTTEVETVRAAADAERDRLASELAAATERAAAAEAATVAERARADEALTRIAEIEAREQERVSAAETALASAHAQAEQLRQDVATAQERMSALEAEGAQRLAASADAASAAQQRVEDLEAQLTVAQSAIVPVQARVDELAGALEAARAAEADLQQRHAAAVETHNAGMVSREEGLTAMRSRAESAEARVADVQRELESVRASRHGRIGAEIAAHRALVVDIMRRMIERETDRARRHQSTPEKLRAWLDSFYSAHEDLMRTALLPAVRIHLAWIGSDHDPVDVAARLAARHADESQRQVRLVLDGDADDLATSLPALLYRWETTRVTVIADELMQKELDHVRER